MRIHADESERTKSDTSSRSFVCYDGSMNNKQTKINRILFGLITLLAVYAGFLTWYVFTTQSANEASDRSLAEQLFQSDIKNK